MHFYEFWQNIINEKKDLEDLRWWGRKLCGGNAGFVSLLTEE